MVVTPSPNDKKNKTPPPQGFVFLNYIVILHY